MGFLSFFHRILRPMGLYRLSESLVALELEVYSRALDSLSSRLADLEREMFPGTARERGLRAYETLLGISSRPVDLEQRRQMLLSRLAIQPGDYTQKGLLNCLLGAGVQAEILPQTGEEAQRETIRVKVEKLLYDFENAEEVLAFVTAMLPAHLEPWIDVGSLTWDILDGSDLSFQALEGKQLSWDKFDIM